MDLPVVAVRTPIMTSLFREDGVLMFSDGDLEGVARAGPVPEPKRG